MLAIRFQKGDMNMVVPSDSQVWTIKAKKGQSIVLSIQSKLADLGVEVIGARGQTVNAPRRGGNMLLTFEEEGVYTVWVTGQEKGEYRIQTIDLDK